MPEIKLAVPGLRHLAQHWLRLAALGLVLVASLAQAQEVQEEPEVPAVANTVEVSAPAADAEITRRLTSILEATGWFPEVDVEVQSGVVFLRGIASTDERRQWAANLARNTEDAVAVVNQLEVQQTSNWDLRPSLRKLQGYFMSAYRSLPIILLALVLLVLTWWSTGITFRLMEKLLGSRLGSELMRDVASRLVAALVFIFGLYGVMRVAGLTNLALTVVGGTGLLGLALGFAFRDIAENFLASVLISIQRPFSKGDFIEVGGNKGFVQSVSTRATLMMTRDGNHVQIPNAIVYKNEITNFTANPRARKEYVVGIGYDDSIDEAQSEALAVLRAHPAVLEEPEPLVLVDELAASTVNLRVSFWVDTKVYDANKVRSAVIRQTKSGFDQAGISMPDEAREVVFPNGVPVTMMQEASAPATTDPTRPSAPHQSTSDAHQAEGGLLNDDEQIEKQARESRSPEEGESLI